MVIRPTRLLFLAYLVLCSGLCKCVWTFANVLESVAATCTTSKQPDVCEIPNPLINATQALEKINNSLVAITGGNEMYYYGQDAVFNLKINSEENDILPIVFINECKVELDSDICSMIHNGSEIELRCTIHNVSEEDDGTKISFYGASSSLSTLKCYHDVSLILHAHGPPLVDVNITGYNIDRHKGVTLSLAITDTADDDEVMEDISETDPELVIECSVYHCDDAMTDNATDSTDTVVMDHCNDTLTYYSNFTVSNNNTKLLLLPPEHLPDHIGEYEAVCRPKNPAGVGQGTKITINLYQGIDSLGDFTVSSATVRVQEDGEFYASIAIINTEALLAITNEYRVNSSCHDHELFTAKIDVFAVNLSKLMHINTIGPLKHYQHNCTFNVIDDVGRAKTVVASGTTFNILHVDVALVNSTVKGGCYFKPHVKKRHCCIVVFNATDNVMVAERVVHTNGTFELDPLPAAGHFIIIVYDYKHVYWEKKIVIEDSNDNDNTTTIMPSATPSSCPAGQQCEDETKHPVLKLIIAIVGTAFSGLILLGIIVALFLWQRQKNNRQSHDLNGENGKNTDTTVVTLSVREVVLLKNDNNLELSNVHSEEIELKESQSDSQQNKTMQIMQQQGPMCVPPRNDYVITDSISSIAPNCQGGLPSRSKFLKLNSKDSPSLTPSYSQEPTPVFDPATNGTQLMISNGQSARPTVGDNQQVNILVPGMNQNPDPRSGTSTSTWGGVDDKALEEQALLKKKLNLT